MTWLHALPREDFTPLFTTWSLAFGAYLLLVAGRHAVTWRHGLWIALAARLAAMPFLPACSDDLYRFIWDGMLSHHGINPLACTPDECMAHPGLLPPNAGQWYALLNHTEYHSTYPPVAQWIYRLSYGMCGDWLWGHVLFLKAIALAADAAAVLLLSRILRRLGQEPAKALWYALHPLVILELTGNLHFEGVMIAGLLGAITLGLESRPVRGVLAMAFSVLAKLHSLMLAPFLPGFRELRLRIASLAGLTALILLVFLVLYGPSFEWLGSVGLWFQKFEFNAGAYYLLRWIGHQWKGYNLIHSIGPMLGVLTLLSFLWIWWRNQVARRITWQVAMLQAYTVFLLLGTTIHPWYLTTLLVLGLIGGFTFPMAWSYLVFLSYSHYEGGGFREHYGWIAVEYLGLGAWALWEWRRRKRNEPLP